MSRIVILLVSLFTANVWAQQSTDMYRVEAAIANQTEAARIAVIKANMGDVITRVVGDSAALQHPLVRQAISEAPNYLAKFSYNSENTIVLNYSPYAIQTLLQRAQLVAGNTTSAQSVSLYIAGVADFTAFKQVQNYLKSVTVIRNINLTSVDKDVLQFTVLLDGDEHLLQTALSAGGRLQMVTGDASSPLTFRWQN